MSGSALAQVRRTVPSEPACDRCRFVVRRVVTLGDREGAGIVSNTSAVARDGRGRYYVSGRGELIVFDVQGKYLQTVGRQGEGPGEYARVSRIIVGRGDTLYLFDAAQRRLTVLSPSYEVVRAHRVATSVGAASLQLPDGNVLVSADVRTPERIGFPLHVIDTAGHILRSFGAESPTYRPGVAYQTLRLLAPANGGKVWTAYKNRYELELWDLRGRLEQVLVRDASWFEPWLLDAPISPEHPPDPRVQAIQVDAAGRLWVLSLVADRNYRDALTRRQGPSGVGYTFTDLDGVFDSIIEVIDPSTGRVVNSARLADHYVQGFLDAGTFFSYREDDEGYPFLDVWRVQLLQP